MAMKDWVDKAKCRNDPWIQDWIKDPEHKGQDFFHDKPYIEQAKKYCENCPVRLLCLAEANSSLDTKSETGILYNSYYPKYQGVMGGTSLRQRRAFRNKTLRQAEKLARMLQMPQDKAS